MHTAMYKALIEVCKFKRKGKGGGENLESQIIGEPLEVGVECWHLQSNREKKKNNLWTIFIKLLCHIEKYTNSALYQLANFEIRHEEKQQTPNKSIQG